MRAGEGVLAVKFSDGANQETTVEPIPIVLKKLDVKFYPEGGDLVGGVPNRVYFTARTTLNKPPRCAARLSIRPVKTVATDRTLSDDQELGRQPGLRPLRFHAATPVSNTPLRSTRRRASEANRTAAGAKRRCCSARGQRLCHRQDRRVLKCAKRTANCSSAPTPWPAPRSPNDQRTAAGPCP